MPSSPTTLDSVGLPLGASAVDFQLKGVDGKTHSLNSLSDSKAVVVVFSCNHCPYVQAYEDRMVQIQKDYSPKGVTLVAINSNDDTGYPEDSYPNMIKRAEERGFNFPYLRDDTQEIARKYGAICTPHVFAFDQQRRRRNPRRPQAFRSRDKTFRLFSQVEKLNRPGTTLCTFGL